MPRFRNAAQPDWDWWGKLWPAPGATLRNLGVSSDDSLLEVGSGNGYFALPAARIVHPAPVYAVDIDAALLEELETLAACQQIDNVVTIHCEACSIDNHLEESVDVCLLANALHGIDEPKPILEAIADSLAETGEFIVVNWKPLEKERTTIDGQPRGPPTELRLSADQTRRIVEGGTGFTAVREVDLPPYHYALAFER